MIWSSFDTFYAISKAKKCTSMLTTNEKLSLLSDAKFVHTHCPLLNDLYD